MGSVMNTLNFPEEGLRFLIESYTREAGVRSLKREITKLCRSVAKDVASWKSWRKGHHILLKGGGYAHWTNSLFQ